MSLYDSYTKGDGLTSEQLTRLKSLVDVAEETSPWLGGLKISLVEGAFFLEDDYGPVCQTKSLDVALTLIAAGSQARQLLDISIPQHMNFIQEEGVTEAVVQVEMDPRLQAIAQRLRDSANARREASSGAPVDHTKEGATIQQVGEGDGRPEIK